MKKLNYIVVASLLLLLSCDKEDDETQAIDNTNIFKVVNDTLLEMNGTIGSNSLTHFNTIETSNPNIKQINIVNCDGSVDDEINLKLSKKVHDKKINIHLNDNGLIASGGTDFFIAGIKRTKGKNTKIGVHSWATDNSTATDFPVGHVNHLPYTNYYVSVGMSQQQSQDFYYFTINAAPANSMHWMTDSEIVKYGLLTH